MSRRAAHGPDASESAPRRRVDAILLLILVATLVPRVMLATTQALVHDEANTSIPLAEKIRFSGAGRYLPLRATNHPALPAYVVKASRSLFDSTEPIGYRGLHVLAGLALVVLTYLLALPWYGQTAARWAAALMAFNEYSLDIGSHATAHVPFLLFVALAVFAFGRCLHHGSVPSLYATGVALALAFYVKEHAALLVPLFFLALCLPAHPAWLRRRHVYLTAAVFVAMIAPDVIWNLTRSTRAQVTYSRHLERIGGVGLSVYPTAFYGKSAVRAVVEAATGQPFDDNTAEYRSMNVVLGALLLGAVVVATLRWRTTDRARPYFLLLFWGVFGFFTLIRRGNPDGLDSVSWIWVDTTMIPAIVLTAALLSSVTGRTRAGLWSLATVSLAISMARVFT